MNCTLEIVGFADSAHFELYDGESPNESLKLDVDLRILIDAKVPAEFAAQMLEAAAERLRQATPADLPNVRRLLRRIGGTA